MCNINIEKIVRLDNDGLVVVSGTVLDCEVDSIEGGHVSVSITCGNNTDVRDAQVFADGRWFAEFNSGCQCGEQVRATATCATDQNCVVSSTVEDLPCIICPKISIKREETEDDVFRTFFEIKCLENGNALVAFQYTFTNDFQFPITVEVDCGPGGSPVSGTSETFAPNESNTVDVTCQYPSPFIPQILIRFLSNSELLGCPPTIVGGPVIEECPKCQRELPTVEANVDACTASFSGDFVSPDCTFLVNFDEAGFTSVPKNSLNFSHSYSQNGNYNVGITMTCGGCSYTLPGVSVVITDCKGKGDDPNDKPPSNPWFCGPLRTLIAVSAGLSLFFLVMIICLPAAWLALLIAAGISATIGAIAGILHSIFCPTNPCNFALLSTAQAALSAGSTLMIYSLCCPWVFWAGLVTLASGIGLLLLWKDKCKKSACNTATEVAYVFLVIIPAIATILLALVVLTPCLDPFWNTILGVIFSFITLYALGCDD